MKLSTKIKNTLSTKLPFTKKYLLQMADSKNAKRYKRFTDLPVDDKLVVFMSFLGRKYADSPRAIYEYMISSPEYADYKFVWAFRYPEKYRFLKKNTQTIVTRLNSNEHYKYYATAGYWITNSRIPSIIEKRPEQVYVQCWHGTPLKRLGLDIKVTGANARHSNYEMSDIYRQDALKYSYMISPSPFCTEKFISAFGLEDVGRSDIVLETGYPRNDDLKTFRPEAAKAIRLKLGILPDKKVILYAPTWRDNQYSSTVGYTYYEEMNFDMMSRELASEYVILFRAHYFVSSAFDFKKYEGFVFDVSDYDEINDLYIISDMLITDYSSVFFDYANLRRPILFFMYDLEAYRDEIRGFYISLEELPGPIVTSNAQLLVEIKKDRSPDSRYDEFNKRYNPLDDGYASKRVVERIFGK